jgi:hypothetical protein
VGETKTESIGQVEKIKLSKGKGVLTNAPHSTTPFLETHYNLEAQYPLCLNDPSGHETKKFAQPLPLMDSFIGSEF